MNVEVGVSQGSVLGSLLFVTYISDLEDALRHSNYSFYADNLTIYIHCNPRGIVDVVGRLNEDVSYIVARGC